MPNALVKRAFLLDLAMVVLFTVMHALILHLESPGPPGRPWWSMMLVTVPAFALLLVRRRWPWVSLLAGLAAATTLTLVGVPENPLNFTILVGVYSVCQRSGTVGAVTATVLAMLWPVLYSWYDPPLSAFVSTVMASIDLFMVVGLAYAVRFGRQRAAQLEHTVELLDQARDQLAAEAVAGERARIAREFHDIVSHNLSVVALRAGVARALVDRDPGHAEQTLRELEHTSRAALGELRGLLGRLREEPAEQGAASGDDPGRHPAPGLHRVDHLVESVRGTGVVWRLDRRGEVRELGPGVEMAAYRIVQEAVTNVLKHAGSGYARVLLDYGSGALRLEVTNHATGPDSFARGLAEKVPGLSPVRGGGSGRGLIGLRERVALLGGTFTAHPVSNGFHLAAVLPCPENSDLA
ncbi:MULTISPECIES: sensor histidine kinase [Saccharopolyspora]|uniref:sensor histidine kinase n=1 Tax=Saccharopolyspora TaxID=1835 RepID=UPI001CD3F71C|nr:MULTISPECIES: histidine kinase [Saccharopolyspora]MCA1189655.1 histidine kinase [Saccharopolyspora sp. 6T]MCA1195842.1 histidine kinase [Saccharopolyspora sp. 6V]MCA1225431.1 histidine kinase [Saccharopolyspora sp. 6M]MCA1279424.1 histidine kinase [Saccharopolyspora sp. 7B]